MSADHRKPVVAFVLLACIATALIFVERAEARNARFFAAFVAGAGETHGAATVAEDLLGDGGWWGQNASAAPQATAARGSVAGDAARPGRRPAGSPTLRDEDVDHSRGHRGRPSVVRDLAPSGSEIARKARRSGGSRAALQHAEDDALENVETAERYLRSSLRSAGHLPTEAGGGLSREIDRVEDRAER